MSAAEPTRARVKRAGEAVVLAALSLLVAWPGNLLALPSALSAVTGGGTPGVFIAEQRQSGKGEIWVGSFRSDDGTVVLPSVRVDPGWGSFEAGQSVPATYTPLPDAWFVLGYEVHPRSGSSDWVYPALTAAVWAGVLVWAVLRVRRRLRRAGLWRQRVVPADVTSPACTCADPDRCRHA